MFKVVVLQARMTSTRYPGKVLADLDGSPMLAQMLRRLKQSRSADLVVLATTVNATDDPLIEVAKAEGVEWARGDEFDVLSRYVLAARKFQADVVIRLTADCPLIDPGIVDKVVSGLLDHSNDCDYASNVLKRTYPKGLDAEAMFADVLFRMDRLGSSKSAREHVTSFLRFERPDLFLRHSVEDAADNSDLRWTVDERDDLELVRTLFRELNLSRKLVPYEQMVSYVRSHPAISAINAQVPR
jgi:spore coat polysaccharide biosynthesis protein SpsF